MISSERAQHRLLIVDDDELTRALLCDLCSVSGYRTEAVEDGEAALQAIAGGGFDLVLLDLMLPKRDGFSVLSELRAGAETRQLPVIILTAMGDMDGKLRGMELGADDFVTKPFKLVELQTRIQAALQVREYRQRMIAAEEELARLRAVDPLTGVGTYSQLKVSLDGELARARRHGRAVSVLLLSIEGLGEARYQRGMEAADAYVLALTAGTMQQLRTADRLFRIEADEFIAVLPESDLDGASRAAERVSEMARELRVPSPKGPLGLTVRIGGAAFPHPRVQTSEDLIREAARAFRTMREAHPDALVFPAATGA